MIRTMLRTSLLALAGMILTTGCSDDSGTTAPDPNPGPGGGQMTTVTIPVDRDTYVRSSSPSSTYGTSSTLRVGAGDETYLRFSLASLPADAIVRTVTLNLTAWNAGGAPQVTVYEIGADDWSENLAYPDRPTSGDAIASFSVPGPLTENTAITFSPAALAGFCKSESIISNRIVSLRLTATGAAEFRSAEGNDGDVQPSLRVTYEMGTRVTLEPVADATVQQGEEAMGSSDALLVDRTIARTFLRFSLGSVPAGAEVHGAALTVYAYQGYAFGGDGNVYTYYVNDDGWNESTVTWDDQPEVSGESLGHWWLWYNSTPVDQVGRNRSAALVGATQAEVHGDRVLSLRLHSPGYRTSYRSREYFFASQRPTLEVLFTR